MDDQFTVVIQHYELSEEHVRQPINDTHLDEVAKFCLKWRKLPSHLKMQVSDVANIERDHATEEERRSEFFQTWKQNNGFDATYEILIGALLEIGHRNDAESVCKMLKTSISQCVPAASPEPPQQKQAKGLWIVRSD